MIYKFYLDGTEVENPEGWEDMVSVIKRDRILKGQFLTMDATFTFTSTGFTYLKNIQDTQGYCAEILLKIEQSVDQGANFINFYDGIFKISDVEFMKRGDNLETDITVQQYARTKVLDNSFFSKIFNNRKLKTNICSGKSKNGLPITPCPVQYLRMFDPATGISVGLDQKEGLLWYDVFKYLIEFMTDADVEFDSSLMSSGGLYYGPVLTYGLPIWNQGGGITLSDADFIANLPQLDFNTFFHETDVRVNLGLYIDNSGSKPKVKIEKWDDLFLNDKSVQINNINELKTRISVEDIFSRLKLGTTETLESLGALSFPETINYIGFKEEEYIVLGKCNIDTEKDLTGTFITSSNVIEEILINNPAGSGTPNKTYNNKFFLIDAEDLGGGLISAISTNWIDPTATERYYNERFTNSVVANQFLKAVPNDLAAYLGGTLDAEFLANRTAESPPAYVSPASPLTINLGFNNDSIAPAFDTNNVYNPGTNEFTVPVLGAGQYSFSVLLNALYDIHIIVVTEGDVSSKLRTQLYLDRYDSFSVLQASYLVADISTDFLYHVTPGDRVLITPFSVQGSATINLNDGDVLKPRYFNFVPTINATPNLGYVYRVWEKINSFFSCTGNTTGGGNYQKYDPSDYPIFENSFEIELSKTKFDLIAAKPLSLIEFSQGEQFHKRGWINELRYNHAKGTASFKLLSAKNTN